MNGEETEQSIIQSEKDKSSAEENRAQQKGTKTDTNRNLVGYFFSPRFAWGADAFNSGGRDPRLCPA